MTRFWLSPGQAVDYVIDALRFGSGQVYIPRMPALSIGKLCEYVVGEVPFIQIPIRPGEKMHETLLTEEETHYAEIFVRDPELPEDSSHFILSPTTSDRGPSICQEYTSDLPVHELSKEELMGILND
jgi:UDP-N-acetylglucosamine 4,6-dehydratase